MELTKCDKFTKINDDKFIIQKKLRKLKSAW